MRQRLFGLKAVDENTMRDTAEMALPAGVFFVRPCHFDVDHAINPHMLDSEGKPNKVDPNLAREQWQNLVSTYENFVSETEIFEGKPNCPDMVFCANQSLPYLTSTGKPAALMSNMENERRHEEVESIQSSLNSRGFETVPVSARSEETLLEGMGDALWVPGKKLICGGFGFRTHESIYGEVFEKTGAPVVTFELKNPKFYHLDTCLSILDDQSVLACKEAFIDEDWLVLKKLFRNVLEVPLEEADSPGFACNAHCPDRKHVIIQRGNVKTEELLEKYGFIPVPVETGEFIKSGGSVFCMKQIYFK